MNYSITPIIFRGTQYGSVKEAIESTGLSRYLIKKEAEYVNPEDKEKFQGTGRKPIIPDTMPTKEEVQNAYTGNVRKDGAKLGITEKVMDRLLDEYSIPRMSLSDAIICKSDQRDKPSKKELEESYKDATISDLLNYYNVRRSKLERWFQSYDIPVKSHAEVMKQKHEKRHDSIKPDSETLLKEYKRLTVYELAIQYGVSKYVITDWLREYGADVSRINSKEEKKLFEYCQSLDDSFIEGDRSLIAPLELDILSHKHKLAIEYCGIYWHSEGMGKTNKYHREKYLRCKELGYKLITVFESDNIDKVKSLIRTHVSANQRIFARNAVIRALDKNTTRDFHKAHHLSNSVGGSVYLGLYYGEQLVMAATFSKSRYNKKMTYECARMTSHSDYTVVGGASKIFKYFFNNYDVDSCVTYADLRFGEGKVYEHCGFTRQKDSGANYFYFKKGDGTLESRVKYQKHKLKKMLNNYDPSLTEYQNMVNNNYDRIWDCGNAVYLYEKET